MVASPEPKSVVDAPAIHALAAAGFVVVCAGGGGIPVADDGRDGSALRGVEAVIDKDLTAAILARDLDADTLVIATDVPNVMIDFGSRPPGRWAGSPSPSCASTPRPASSPAAAWARRSRPRCASSSRAEPAPSSRPWNTSPTPSQATTPAPS